MTLISTPSSFQTGFDRVWEALDAGGFKPERPRNDHFNALCPVHGDTHRSLSVDYDRHREAVLLNCFTCKADVREICASIGLQVKDLFDKPLPEREHGQQRPKAKPRFAAAPKLPRRITGQDIPVDDLKGAKWERVTTYPYFDADGTLVEEVVREQAIVNGEVKKRFKQRFLGPSGRMVSKKPEGFTPVLYRHPEVLQAVEGGVRVWLLEGEKDVENAENAGVVATTNAQGSGSFPVELAAVFAGADVAIVADRDAAGYTRAATLFDLLTGSGIGATVALYRPIVEADKADLTDHLEAGHSLADLEQISPATARLLALVCTMQKSLAEVQVCREEVDAHLDLIATTGAKEDSQRAVEIWAAESARRAGRMQEVVADVVAMNTPRTVVDRDAVDTARTIVENAFEIARETHQVADQPIPAMIPKKSAAVPPAAGADMEPPQDLGDDHYPDDDGTPNEGARFGVRHGQTVQIRVERDGDSYRNRYVRVFDGWAEILSAAYEDSGHETTSTPPTTEIIVRFRRWVRNEMGKPIRDANGDVQIEEATVVWDQDQLRDGSWSQALPWLGMLESSSRRGKELFWDAMHKARRSPSQRSRVYTGTGWRESDTGPYFVHAGGAITAKGALEVRTRLQGGVKLLRLPDPTLDPAALREAWLSATLPQKNMLPARVIAPLLGLVWHSPFDPVPMITYMHGAAGSGKSSCMRQGLQYFAPEVRNSGGAKTILSATNAGSTSAIPLLRLLSTARHMPVGVDDFVDTDIKKAVAKLDTITRAMFDRNGRDAAAPRGQVGGTPIIDASVIATGQVALTGSGIQRLFTIGIDPGEIKDPYEVFSHLERKNMREKRGQLGAALVQWLATHRSQLLEEYLDEDSTAVHSKSVLDRYWMNEIRNLPHTDGAKGRMKDGAVCADTGIRLMLRMLVSIGAITGEEATEFHNWARAGIFEALIRQDDEAGDPGMVALELIREALGSGSAHLIRTDSGAPEFADQLGWTRRGVPPEESWAPNGIRIGAIKDDPTNPRVYLHPRVVFDVISRLASSVGEPLTDTRHTISSSFLTHGWLERDNGGNHASGRRVEGKLARVWDIPLNVLLNGADGPGNTPSSGGDSPAPFDDAPGLFDAPIPGADEPPTPEPAAPQPTPESTLPESGATPGTDAQLAATHQAPTPERKPTTGGFTASLAVMHTDGIWLPDGTKLPRREIRHLGDVAIMVSELHLGTKNGWKTEAGQIFITADMARELGIAIDELPSRASFNFSEKLHELTVDHPLVLGALAAGYQVGGKGNALNATTRIWHPDNRQLQAQLVIIPALKDDFDEIGDPVDVVVDAETGKPVTEPTDRGTRTITVKRAADLAPAVIARRLQKFADMLHAPYSVSASSTGLDLMMHLAPTRELREQRFAPSTPVPPAEIATLEADINWSRRPTEEERQHKYVHAYDRGGSYLAGIPGLELGVGEPHFYPQGTSFDKRVPGYWKVTMPEKGEWLTPNPLDPRNRDQDISGMDTWVSTPTLEIAIDLGYEFEIHEAYVWPEHTRFLDTWYERIRDARTALDTDNPDDQAARDLLKALYTRSLGLMASFEFHAGRPGFAPERYHAIQARSRANILRRIHKIGKETGRWPVAIIADTILYTSDEADPAKAWPDSNKGLSRNLGQFKHEGSALLAEHIQFLTGEGRYVGKEHLQGSTQ